MIQYLLNAVGLRRAAPVPTPTEPIATAPRVVLPRAPGPQGLLPLEINCAPPVAPDPAPPKTYTQAEFDAAHEQGFQKGYSRGKANALASAESRVAKGGKVRPRPYKRHKKNTHEPA